MISVTRSGKTGFFLAVLVAVSLVVPHASVGQDRDRDRDQLRLEDQHLDDPVQLQKRDQLRDQISKDTALTASDLDALEPELSRAVRLSGDIEPVRVMVRTVAANDCLGECLREMLRTMNQAMEQGVGSKQAQAMVCEELQARLRTRNRAQWQTGELCQEVRARVQERVAASIQTREKYKGGETQGPETGSGAGGGQGEGGDGGERGR